MTLLEAIKLRHSVRRYTETPLAPDIIQELQEKIEEINHKSGLHIQLIVNEPKAYKGIFAYGKFSGVTNYFVIAGNKGKDMDETAGYYGELLVLYAQQLGLNTCWTGLSYQKVKNTYTLNEGEHVICYIALGYGESQGCGHKSKPMEEISNVSDQTPDWFHKGIEAVCLAPTAINQQKFYFKYNNASSGKPKVSTRRDFSLAGYTKIDLGIAKLHFEIAAGKENFDWA